MKIAATLLAADRRIQERFTAELITNLTIDARAHSFENAAGAAKKVMELMDLIHSVSGMLAELMETDQPMRSEDAEFVAAVYGELSGSLQRHLRARFGIEAERRDNP